MKTKGPEVGATSRRNGLGDMIKPAVWGLGGAVLIAAAVAMWGGSGGTAAAAIGAAMPGGADSMPAEQVRARAAAFAQLGGVVLPSVPPNEMGMALQSITGYQPKQIASITQDIKAGRAELVYLTLWDDRVVDGDAVSIISAGITVQLPLTGQPQTIALPVAGSVWITGTHDGGGGITVAVQTATGPAFFPVLAVGQTLEVPVR